MFFVISSHRFSFFFFLCQDGLGRDLSFYLL